MPRTVVHRCIAPPPPGYQSTPFQPAAPAVAPAARPRPEWLALGALACIALGALVASAWLSTHLGPLRPHVATVAEAAR